MLSALQLTVSCRVCPRAVTRAAPLLSQTSSAWAADCIAGNTACRPSMPDVCSSHAWQQADVERGWILPGLWSNRLAKGSRSQQPPCLLWNGPRLLSPAAVQDAAGADGGQQHHAAPRPAHLDHHHCPQPLHHHLGEPGVRLPQLQLCCIPPVTAAQPGVHVLDQSIDLWLAQAMAPCSSVLQEHIRVAHWPECLSVQAAGLGTLSAHWTHLGGLHRPHPLLPDPGRLLLGCPAAAKHLHASRASNLPAARPGCCGVFGHPCSC